MYDVKLGESEVIAILPDVVMDVLPGPAPRKVTPLLLPNVMVPVS